MCCLRGEEFLNRPQCHLYNPEKVLLALAMVEIINRAVHHHLIGQRFVRTRNLGEIEHSEFRDMRKPNILRGNNMSITWKDYL